MSARACYDHHVAEDLVRFAGWGTLKLVTWGRYRSDDDSIFLEGVVGLFGMAALLYVLSRLAL